MMNTSWPIAKFVVWVPFMFLMVGSRGKKYANLAQKHSVSLALKNERNQEIKKMKIYNRNNILAN
jgi:hypothetical protein